LVFTTADPVYSPGTRKLRVFNIGASPLTFTAGRPEQQNLTVTVAPRDGQLDPAQPSVLLVGPEFGFSAGVYQGDVTFQFSDGRLQSVHITVISTAPPDGFRNTRGADGCTPNKLLPALQTLGPSFT